MTLGQRIREYRLAAEMTQKDLAGKVGIDNSTLSKIEHDKVEPSLDLIAAMADALGVADKELTGKVFSRRPVAEDKEIICKLFVPVLQRCRAYPDLVRLDYHMDEMGNETVIAVAKDPAGKYPPSEYTIDVTADSGIAMLKDILKKLG